MWWGVLLQRTVLLARTDVVTVAWTAEALPAMACVGVTVRALRRVCRVAAGKD